MRTYARVKNGIVQEVITPYADESGTEVPIEQRFTPELVADLVDVTGLDPVPDQRWTYEGLEFNPPTPYKPSPEEILRLNQAEQAVLMSAASQAMTPLFLAIQLGDATDEEILAARAWRAYYQQLQSVDLAAQQSAWPVAPK